MTARKKVTLEQLRAMLANAEVRTYDNDFIVRMNARDGARKLRQRINRREKDEAMASLGLTKCKVNGRTIYE